MAEIFNLNSLINFGRIRSRGIRSPFGRPRTGIDVGDVTLTADVHDQTDGHYIVCGQCGLLIDGVTRFQIEPRHAEGLRFEVTQGEADIIVDSYTGRSIIHPKSDTPVKVRPLLDATYNGQEFIIKGSDVEIGISTDSIPDSQLIFPYAGGGACHARVTMDGMPPYEFSLRVRAIKPANVIPRDINRREIIWRHDQYFASDPQLGLMRLHHHPERVSRTVMNSLTPVKQIQGHNFFPAKGFNELYFILDLPNFGIQCFNKEPMIQSFQNIQWPPYDVPLGIDNPIKFYNLAEPDKEIMILLENHMQIYDYRGIEIEKLEFDIASDGNLSSHWLVRNQAAIPITAQWFTLGNFDRGSSNQNEGTLLLAASGQDGDSVKVEFNTTVSKSILSQFITMNVTSIDSTIVMGTERVKFNHPKE